MTPAEFRARIAVGMFPLYQVAAEVGMHPSRLDAARAYPDAPRYFGAPHGCSRPDGLLGTPRPVNARAKIEALLDLLGRPWPWDSGLSRLLDQVLLAEEGAA